MNTLRVLAILMLGVMVSCAGFGPASAATRALVKRMDLAAQVPCEQFVVELDSPHLAGVYEALYVVEQGTVRMQLFPDVGGKVLDLTIDPEGITAQMPASTYRAVAPFAEAEPHLALVFAAVLAELRTPVAGRVRGERAVPGGQLEVRLEPAIGSGTVAATLAADGRIQRYRIALGRLQFTLHSDGSFAGRGFAGRLCP